MEPSIIISVAGLVLAVVVMLVIAPSMAKESSDRKKEKNVYVHTCPDCQSEVRIIQGGLKHLDPADAAMIVRLVPDAPMYHIGETRCPKCQSWLAFRIDQWPPGFLTVNATEGHVATNSCTQCRKPLRKPEFPKGAYDGESAALAKLPIDIGLICSRCNALNCVACVVDATRGRTKDGSLLCPRCYRGPVDKVHHG